MKLTPAQELLLSKNELKLLQCMKIGTNHSASSLFVKVYGENVKFDSGRLAHQRIGAIVSALNKRKLPVMALRIVKGNAKSTYRAESVASAS